MELIPGDIETFPVGSHEADIFTIENTVNIVHLSRGVGERGVGEAEWWPIEDCLAIALLAWGRLFATLEDDDT